MTRPILAAAAALAWLAAPAAAQDASASATVDAGRAFMAEVAMVTDADGDGRIAPRELARLSGEVFASMDGDGDGRLTRAEMAGWRHGPGAMAAHRGRAQAFEAAAGMVFALFDRDGDGAVTAAEHARGTAVAAGFADLDGDGAMSMAEFEDRFIVNVALREALRPS